MKKLFDSLWFFCSRALLILMILGTIAFLINRAYQSNIRKTERKAEEAALIKALEADQNDRRNYCLYLGFDTVFIVDEVYPPVFYCLELPMPGELGLIIRTPDIIEIPSFPNTNEDL